jgi:hypothetical protein
VSKFNLFNLYVNENGVEAESKMSIALEKIINGSTDAPYHRRMARGAHGLPKVSPGLAMPDPSCPAGGPPPKRPYGLWPSSTLLDTPCCTPMLPTDDERDRAERSGKQIVGIERG